MKRILMIFAALAALVSCKKVEEFVQPQAPEVTITAEHLKTVIDNDGAVTWDGNETLSVLFTKGAEDFHIEKYENEEPKGEHVLVIAGKTFEEKREESIQSFMEISIEELLGGKPTPFSGHKGAEYIIPIVLKAIPLAMGVAVAVLAILGQSDTRSGFTMLGIGLACVGISSLKDTH